MNKTLTKYFYVVLSICVCFIAFSFIISTYSDNANHSTNNTDLIDIDSNWFYYNEENKCVTIELLPEQMFFTGNSELTIYRDFSVINDCNRKLTLAFFTNYQTVNAYNNNELLYDSSNIYVPFGRSTGGSWHFIELPSDVDYSNFAITLKNDYNTTSFSISNFYLGNTNDIRASIFASQIPTLVVCAFLFTIGILFIIMKVFFGPMSIRLQSLHYLGLFSLLTSVWTLVQTHTLQLVLPNQLPIFYLGYCMTTLISIPLILFVRECYQLFDSKFITSLCIIAMCSSFSQMLLQILNIADFYQMAVPNYIFYAFTLLYLLYQCVKHLRITISNKSLTTYIYAGCIPIIIISALMDICRYILCLGTSGILFLEYSLSIYILTLGYVTIFDSIKLINKGLKAEKFQMLAYIDVLTGIRNRASFKEYINEIPKSDYSHYSILMLDMNNLKVLNDTYGHSAGDEYIIKTAHIISKVFSEYGMVCRLGGDEFCCVLKDISEMEYTQCIEILKERCDKFKSTKAQLPLSVAYGLANFDDSRDFDLIDTFNRADLEMYKNKQLSKR